MKLTRYFLLLLISSILLMVIAFYNGYAITDSDTNSYIYTGFSNLIGRDRPPFYGWFIRYSSFWASLWLTIFFQSLILSYLVLKYIDLIQKKVAGFSQALTAVIIIVSFTCVSWITSFLMPDIFAGILLLATLLFMSAARDRKSALITYVLIIFFCMLVHNSHLLIMLLFSTILAIWALLKKHKTILKRCVVLVSISFLSWLSLCSVNKINGHGFTFSPSGHVFIMGRLSEMGILRVYLSDNCAKKNMKLCNYKDNLPVYSWDFIWQQYSPFYKTGGWDSSEVEYTGIIHDIFTSPKYMKMLAQKSAVGTLRTLTQIEVPDHYAEYGKNTGPGQVISLYFNDDTNEYVESLQNTGQLSGTTFNIFYCFFFILSTVWILFNRKNINEDHRLIYGCIILFFIINAFVMSTFSAVLFRYQNRIFWILPATNAIFMVKYYWNKFQSVD